MKPAGRLAILSCLLALSSTGAHAEFGVVTDAKVYTVDSGAGLVFRVTRSTGNIESIVLNGTELNDKKDSGIASGLGPQGTTVSAWSDANAVKITVATDKTNGVAAEFTQYYIVRKGENTIYMATHAVNEPRVGELRWITRLQSSLFPNTPEESTIRGTTKGVESKDVFGTEDGLTRSKYYGNQRAKDLSIRGVTGTGRGVFVYYGSRESSSGGPFYRDIQNQSGSTTEVYNYMNSGHAQTEKPRLGVLHGPYAVMFTGGNTPAVPDMGFIANLGLTGYVPASGRGKVAVRGITGRDAVMPYTVAFSNASAQYWTDASRSDGSALSPFMKPGQYTMTVYKNELSVYSAPVTVTAGQTTTVPPIAITTDPASIPAIWRIGVWDGTPIEFRNGANLNRMHPSDKRQAPWQAGEFIVGKTPVSGFPAAMWRGVNEPVTVSFTLTPAQVKDHVLRIGTSTSFSGGRPSLSVNSKWNAPLQKPVGQPDSRSLTIGTYRTNYASFSFRVPASALVAGENKLQIGITSGNGGSGFISPSFAIDCVDFY